MTRWEVFTPSTGAGHADPLVERLSALAGAGRVLVLVRSEGTRGPRCVVQPESTEAVGLVVRALREGGVPWRVVATPPPFDPPDAPAGGVYIDLSRLQALLGVEETSLLVSVQAGIAWGRLEALIGRRGLTLGPLPTTVAGRSIAESVALNDRLRPSPRYGQLLDAIHAVAAVLPSGEVARTTAAPRRATGPDLPSALLGTRHRNGILTEVQLQVWRRPAERLRVGFSAPDWPSADAVVRGLLRGGLRPGVVFAQGAGPVEVGLELASAAEVAELGRRLAVAPGVAPRTRVDALEAALGTGETLPDGDGASVVALVEPAALAAAVRVLPGATSWSLGEPFIALTRSASLDAASAAALAALGARLSAEPTDFSDLDPILSRALRREA